MSGHIVGVVIAHEIDGLDDLLRSVRRFAPRMEIVLYDSGSKRLGKVTGLPTIPGARPLQYAKIGACFLDIMEWFVERAAGHAWISLETDMLFVRAGFTEWLAARMTTADYVAARFHRVEPRSRWRPARSLRAVGRRTLLEILGGDALYGAFSPGQVFGSVFCRRMVAHPRFDELRQFMLRHEGPGGAYSMQETVFPSAAMALRMQVAGYPDGSDFSNRYRPWFGRGGIERALADDTVFFVHPVRRDPADPARQALVERS
jgi:hypothetical protein